VKPKKEEVLHYASYVALHIGHTVRYVMLGDFFGAARSAALAEAALELAVKDIPDDWDGFSSGEAVG
jgi:hypothetical protein